MNTQINNYCSFGYFLFLRCVFFAERICLIWLAYSTAMDTISIRIISKENTSSERHNCAVSYLNIDEDDEVLA